MLQKGLSGAAEETREFRPRVRIAHINNPDGLDPWLWRFDSEQLRWLAALDAAPELALGRDDEMLIERIGMGQNLDPSLPR